MHYLWQIAICHLADTCFLQCQLIQLIAALRRGRMGGDLMLTFFEKGQHNSFWVGAKQKALALHAGHSHVSVTSDRARGTVLVLLPSNFPVHG